MNSRRTARIAQAILEQVSTTILFGLKDPRVKNVTVTGVEVSPDVRSAKVKVSVMGDETQQSLCLHGLNSARGYLQSKVGDRIQTRYTPILHFELDQGVKKSLEAARILREVLGSSPSTEQIEEALAEEDARNASAEESSSAAPEEAPPADNAEATAESSAEQSADDRSNAGNDEPHSDEPHSEAPRAETSGDDDLRE